MSLNELGMVVSSAFLGCHANVMTLESILKTDEGTDAVALLTFLQFLTVGLLTIPLMLKIDLAAESTMPKSRTGKVPRAFFRVRIRPLRIPLYHHAKIAICFWVLSVMTNYVYEFGLSVPTHTVFKSSTLFFNIAYGVLVFGKRFTWQQIVCAAVIVFGLITLSLAPLYLNTTAATNETNSQPHPADSSSSTTWEWLQGVLILVFISSLSPIQSLLQEQATTTIDACGNTNKKPESESSSASASISPAPLWAGFLFFNHIFSLPLFLFRLPKLVSAFGALQSIGFSAVMVNVLTQFVCVASVSHVSVVAGAFTATLVVTVRKFLSLVFSVFYFNHFDKLSSIEWVAMLSVGAAASIYPLLPKWKGNEPRENSKKTNKIKDE